MPPTYNDIEAAPIAKELIRRSLAAVPPGHPTNPVPPQFSTRTDGTVVDAKGAIVYKPPLPRK